MIKHPAQQLVHHTRYTSQHNCSDLSSTVRLHQTSCRNTTDRLAAWLCLFVQGDGGTLTSAGVQGVQVNPRTGSRLKAEVRCDGAPLAPASPRFARHNHNHLGGAPANTAAVPGSGPPVAANAAGEAGCASACPRCACCGCTLREAAARHEQRVAANERLERANIEWKQVAVVADRALLAVFVLVTAISTAAILLPQLNNLHVGNTPLKPPI
ncbi:hypothetical protein PYW07_007257 [Mythimna separata]|uniref:Uncharacterized protein n=1 Tax=Mythimna separata TaxID=271217 RepID=A0AAD7Z3M7_MYTSE|nr:hypothetical protein PYW07_007257 [Mythimna separata]